jgi:hypothetical protein
MKRRMNRNRLEEGLLDLLVPDLPDLKNQVEDLPDLLVPDLPDLRNQVEDLPDLLVPDLPDQRNREEDRLGLRNQEDPLDLLVPDLVGHRKADHPDQRKADHLGHRREDHPVADLRREGLPDQRKADLLDQRKVDHLGRSVALRSDEAFICLKSPMILEIFVFLENCAHHKLLQYQLSNLNWSNKENISTL